jgi:hypothetical protein
MDIGDMLVAGERVADEHQIRLRRVQFAISLIGDGEGCEAGPAIERQRLMRREMHDLALRIGDLRQPQGVIGKSLRRRCLAHRSLVQAAPTDTVIPAKAGIQ